MNNPFDLPKSGLEPEKIVKQDLMAYKLEDTILNALPKDTKLSAQQLEMIKAYSNNAKYGIMSFMPIICKGRDCVYYSKCPLAIAKVELPIGASCPVEIGLQSMWFNEFVRASGVDLEDSNNYLYDMLMLNDLAAYQMLDARATMEMANDPSIVQKQFVAFDKEGVPITATTMNPIVLFKEKIAKIKMKYLQELIATRKAKSSDAKAAVKGDKSTLAAEMLRRIKENAKTIEVVDMRGTSDPEAK